MTLKSFGLSVRSCALLLFIASATLFVLAADPKRNSALNRSNAANPEGRESFPEGLRVLRLTGNPAVDEPARSRIVSEMRAAQQQLVEEVYAASMKRHEERRKGWEGTQVKVSEKLTDPQTRSLLEEEIAPLFAADLEPPAKRMEFFKDYLGEKSRLRCIGWKVLLLDACPIPGGCLVSMSVEAQLLGPTPRVVGGAVATLETWHISLAGEISVVEVEIDPGSRMNIEFEI